MHPVLKAAIDSPRMATPYSPSRGEKYTERHDPTWTGARLKQRPSFLPRLLLMSDLTLLGEETLLEANKGKTVVRRPVKRLDGSTGAGAPITARPANDNDKALRWPLYDEYVADRLGKDSVANSRNWNTALWIDGILVAATKPANFLPPMHMSSELEIEESDVDGYGVEVLVPKEAKVLISVLETIAKEDSKRLTSERVYGAPPTEWKHRDHKLPFGNELRVDAQKIQRMLQVSLRGLWRPVRQAIAEQLEMWKIGTEQGVGRDYAPTAGRQRVIDGLEIAAEVRKDLMRWEGLSHRLAESTCSPLGSRAADLPAEWRIAANDDARRAEAA